MLDCDFSLDRLGMQILNNLDLFSAHCDSSFCPQRHQYAFTAKLFMRSFTRNSVKSSLDRYSVIDQRQPSWRL